MKKWTSKLVVAAILLSPAVAWAATNVASGGCPLGCC